MRVFEVAEGAQECGKLYVAGRRRANAMMGGEGGGETVHIGRFRYRRRWRRLRPDFHAPASDVGCLDWLKIR